MQNSLKIIVGSPSRKKIPIPCLFKTITRLPAAMEEKKARRKFSQLTRNRKQASERGGKKRREEKREAQSQRRSQGQREQAERTVAGSPSRPPRRGRRRQRPTKSLQPRASARPPGGGQWLLRSPTRHHGPWLPGLAPGRPFSPTHKPAETTHTNTAGVGARRAAEKNAPATDTKWRKRNREGQEGGRRGKGA